VVAGTPEQVAATQASATGQYLARVLRGEPIIPLQDVSFAEAAGRGSNGNGRSGRSRGAKTEKTATAAR
jgi:hypothetical protein